MSKASRSGWSRYRGPGGGWGWGGRHGPPQRGYYGHRRRDSSGGIAAGIGGFFGQLIGSQLREPEPPVVVVRRERGPEVVIVDSDTFTHAMRAISDVPDGGRVSLTPAEIRTLSDRKMVEYKDDVAHVLGRRIDVVEDK